MTYNTRTHEIPKGLYAVLLAVLTAVLMNSCMEVLDRPIVQQSYMTGECVRVLDAKAEHNGEVSKWSCDNLPESYTLQKVE